MQNHCAGETGKQRRAEIIIFVYIFIYIKAERERYLAFSDSFAKYLQQPKQGQAEIKSPDLPQG